ncbi:MAG: type II toxin-antitoxin system PrlF family antitoxin [Cyanobacteria bacterium J06621_11]
MSESFFAVAESTLTDRYQTTVPASIRKALGLEKQDKLAYYLCSDGSVRLSRLEEEKDDPVMEKFLAFLNRDIEENPQQVKPISSDWLEQARDLVSSVDMGDINALLPPEDEDE